MAPHTVTLIPPPVAESGNAVEFDRVVPPSGNLQVAGKQFWLGPARSGVSALLSSGFTGLVSAGCPNAAPRTARLSVLVARHCRLLVTPPWFRSVVLALQAGEVHTLGAVIA
jgi:hypothetical protein